MWLDKQRFHPGLMMKWRHPFKRKHQRNNQQKLTLPYTSRAEPLPLSVQFSLVAQSCLTLCVPMNCSTPGRPVHYQLPEFTQTHILRVGDAIQASHPVSFPSPPAPSPSQHQSLFQWISSSHEVAKVLKFQLQHHSLQRNPRADLLQNGLAGPEQFCIVTMKGGWHSLSCVWLCNLMVCSPPGSSIHGISQARTPEQVAISSSRGSSRFRDHTSVFWGCCFGRWILYHRATWEAFIWEDRQQREGPWELPGDTGQPLLNCQGLSFISWWVSSQLLFAVHPQTFHSLSKSHPSFGGRAQPHP